jgi:hypothetical protein
MPLAGKEKNSGKVRVGGPYYKHFKRMSPYPTLKNRR